MEIDNLIWPLAIAALVASYLALLKPAWSGVRGKTAWDWIALMLVPSMVGFGTFLISAAQTRVEENRQQEVAMQQYFDRISHLLLSEGGLSREKSAVGRAHTVAILSLVSGERAGRVLVFLDEVGVMELFVNNLENQNFDGAELKDFDLHRMDFEGSSFRDADLEDSDLSRTDFEDTNLRGADLDGVDFSRADFEGANLKDATLVGTDFRGADLSDALGLTNRALARACYDGTTKLPAGIAAVSGKSPGCSGDANRDEDDD